ncbi:MAG: amidohydrolase [Gemmatimonadetes bacterium]|nr:amidohydrolase [Gemmatimonadota bacterium]
MTSLATCGRRLDPGFAVFVALAVATSAGAQRVDSLSAEARKYLRVTTPRIILAHVRVIDGTGAAAVEDQNITVDGGKIMAISPGADAAGGEGTTVFDLRGHSVMPGIVGMHDHIAYIAQPNLAADASFEAPPHWVEMSFSAPRLYLANGVTTLRTVGSIEPYTDIKVKRAIEAGVMPGPHMDVTGPFLEGPNPLALPMPELSGPEDARQTVAFWADRGVTSFKAYQDITREELRAAVAEAHQRGLKVTGHLCSVTYDEAVEIGIDNLEHGFSANTALDPGKQPDTCSASGGNYTLEHMSGAEADRLIANLVRHHVAITSTLPGRAATVARESSVDHGPAARDGELEAMSPQARDAYVVWRNRPIPPESKAALLLRKDMDLQRAFVAAGGLLIAGPDPVGLSGLVPGFADQREIELLVDAGFSPVEAIRIATLNGAIFLGRQTQIGSIAPGKNADLVVVRGNPAERIRDIENVEIVFKDGAAYDTKKLLASVKGRYGQY